MSETEGLARYLAAAYIAWESGEPFDRVMAAFAGTPPGDYWVDLAAKVQAYSAEVSGDEPHLRIVE